MKTNLYETDFNLWLELTIKQLESHDSTELDTVNLMIEQILEDEFYGEL